MGASSGAGFEVQVPHYTTIRLSITLLPPSQVLKATASCDVWACGTLQLHSAFQLAAAEELRSS